MPRNGGPDSKVLDTGQGGGHMMKTHRMNDERHDHAGGKHRMKGGRGVLGGRAGGPAGSQVAQT